MKRMKQCDVCEGRARYPIFNKFSEQLYEITCPECHGAGECEEDDDKEATER